MLKITIWPCKSKEALKGDKQMRGHHSLVHTINCKDLLFLEYLWLWPTGSTKQEI